MPCAHLQRIPCQHQLARPALIGKQAHHSRRCKLARRAQAVQEEQIDPVTGQEYLYPELRQPKPTYGAISSFSQHLHLSHRHGKLIQPERCATCNQLYAH